MARVLLGWELGGNRGHAEPLKALATALIADGHYVVIAAKEPARFAGFEACVVMQAPIWPGLMGIAPAPGPAPAANMGDILIGLGMSMPGTFASLIRSWDAILTGLRPDVVIADYAPALACATRGRIRTIACGTGFCQPPAQMVTFPDLVKLSEKVVAVPLLDMINDELAATGRSEVTAPPAIFATDDNVVACFAEFDPYRQWRTGSYALPHMAPLAPKPDTQGDEVFVYFNRADGSATMLWDALAASGLKTRVFIAQSDRQAYQPLQDRGLIVEPEPLSWAQIAHHARIVVSHGGLGFTSGALAMGLTHVVVPHDLEKIVTGLTVRKIGVGDCLMPYDDQILVASRIAAIFDDAKIQEATRSASAVIGKRVARHRGRDDVTIIRNMVSQKGAQEMAIVRGVAA